MSRREFPARVKIAAYERCSGACEGCGARLTVGKFHYDHDTPDGLGGEPTLENCRVLCWACHAVKTRTGDVPAIAKAKRREAKFLGAKTSRTPMPFGRQSKFKRKLNGTIVRRGE
jgi:5-methylcytosine-specific restriction enzyme A